MTKKKETQPKPALVVQGEILPTMVIDCSNWVPKNPGELWTHGPALPVTSINGKRPGKGHKKRS